MQEWIWHKQLLLTLLKHIIPCRESVAQKKTFPLIFMAQTNALIIYLDFQSTKQALWLVDSWSHAPDPIQMYGKKNVQLLPVCLVQQHVFAIWLFKRKYKIYNKALNIWSLGKLVSFCFAWCFSQLPLGKQDFCKNKTKCFPQYYTLSVCCLWGE